MNASEMTDFEQKVAHDKQGLPTMRDFYAAMMNTAEQCGLKVIGDDLCCKLLAWLYVYGGGKEKTTAGGKLSQDLFIAQKRLGLYGGERPNTALIPTLQGYVKECIRERSAGAAWEDRTPGWVSELEERYGKL